MTPKLWQLFQQCNGAFERALRAVDRGDMAAFRVAEMEHAMASAAFDAERKKIKGEEAA